MRDTGHVRIDRAITNYFREYWPERPYVMSLVAAFGVTGMAVGAVPGFFLGDWQAGLVFGLVAGVFLGIAWMFIAVATWGRSSRRWEESQRETFVKPSSNVRRMEDET